MDKILSESLEDAIESKTEVLLGFYNAKDQQILVRFQAYILGIDLFKFPFVWGYLPLQNTYYKFKLSIIEKAFLCENAYDVNLDAIYKNAFGEKHIKVLLGFKMIYLRSIQTDTSLN